VALSWDENKRRATQEHRNLDFADAVQAFAGFKVDQVDDRNDYGEERILTIGVIDLQIVAIVWTLRDNTRRIISMRKANAKEEQRYRDSRYRDSLGRS
jgi:uncharacterized protein